MKIIHTSDWHLGKKLKNFELLEEHKLFLDWLISQIQLQLAEILIVSGDIFDTYTPSNAAKSLYYNFLAKLSATTCKNVIIIAGNHDSIHDLATSKELLANSNIHIVESIPENIEEAIFSCKSKLIENQEVLICGIPFLRDDYLNVSGINKSPEERKNAVRLAIKKVYDDFAEKCQELNKYNSPCIATGHLFAIGGKTSESERDIHVGGLGNINSKDFPPNLNYIALGHLHRSQIVGDSEKIRYSGSPIRMGFDEKGKKSIVLLETNENSVEKIEKVEIPEFRQIKSFRGNFDKLKSQIEEFSNETNLTALFELHHTDGIFLSAEIETLEVLANAKNVKILAFHSKNTKVEHWNEIMDLEQLDETTVFQKKIQHHTPENQEILLKTFKELLEIKDEILNQQ